MLGRKPLVALKSFVLRTAAPLTAEERAEKQAVASATRKRWGRRFGTAVALLFAVSSLVFSAAPAHAWPWDDLKENLTSTIVNFCKPNNVPLPATAEGFDTALGLNPGSEEARVTVVPDFTSNDDGAAAGNGSDRLRDAYAGVEGADLVANPTYERYGFTSLRWVTYGKNCFDVESSLGAGANILFDFGVKWPIMMSMSLLDLALNDTMYEAFATMIQPFTKAMYDIFNPWIYFAVPLGVFIAWVISRGSLQKTAQAGAWGAFVLALFLLMSNSTSSIVSSAANLVTGVSGTAACKMADAANGAATDCSADSTTASIKQALWYGVPYQTWLLGQVDAGQAQKDRAAQAAGEVGWGPAMLNANYVGSTENGEPDVAGAQVLAATERWNQADYSTGDNSKVVEWTRESAWAASPFLANVKIMCNDTAALGEESREMGPDNRWMYSGGTTEDGENFHCDAAGAGTTNLVENVNGGSAVERVFVAASGAVSAFPVVLAVGGAAIYLAFQKVMFFFLLFMGAPIILVSAFGDRKRRSFLVRYAELLGANLLKQVVGVCVVLFVSHSFGSLLNPAGPFDIPWMLRPYLAVVLFLALAFLAFPLRGLARAAVSGDTSAVDKLATAPQRGVKNAAKVAAAAGVVVATGGAGAALLGAGGSAAAMAGGLGKAGVVAGQAGRLLGTGSKVGKALRSGGKLMNMGSSVLNAQATKSGKADAVNAAARSLVGDQSNEWRDSRGNLREGAEARAFERALATKPRDVNGNVGARDRKAAQLEAQEMVKDRSTKYLNADGSLRPDAQKLATRDAKAMQVSGQTQSRAQAVQDAQMAQFFTGYKATTGRFHQDDPTSPENQLAAKVEREHEREGLKRAAIGGTPSYEQARASYGAQARGNLSGPAFARDAEYAHQGSIPGDEVLSAAQLAKEQVLANPAVLVAGEAYGGGSTTAMDPFHPATSALNTLRFAAVGGGEPDIERAIARAVDAIQSAGVPNQVSDVHSINARAASFEPIQIVGAMPTLTADTTWSERADAAHTMIAASVAMPEGFEQRDVVREYTAALANPAVDIAVVEQLKIAVVDAIAVAQPGATVAEPSGWAATADSVPSAPTYGHEPAPASAPQASVSAEPRRKEPTMTDDRPESTPPRPAPAVDEVATDDQEAPSFRPTSRRRRAFTFLGGADESTDRD